MVFTPKYESLNFKCNINSVLKLNIPVFQTCMFSSIRIQLILARRKVFCLILARDKSICCWSHKTSVRVRISNSFNLLIFLNKEECTGKDEYKRLVGLAVLTHV